MKILKSCVVLAACLVLCASHPTQNKALPVLKEQPAEVLFRADNYSTVLLECATENGDKDVEYAWFKNGAPFDWKAAGHIRQRKGEGSIMFFNPQPQDEGIYQCFAKTSVGTASTRPISLKKAFLNVPKVETQEHTPVYGKPYKLECDISKSYPKPNITWKTQLRSDPSVVENILNRRITLSPDGTLWFSNVTYSDISPSFKYICVAQTPAVTGDVILAEHFLKSVIENPEANNGELVPQYLSPEVMFVQLGNVTEIYCIYGGTPLGFPNWYKDNKLIDAKPGDRVTDHNRTSGKRLLIKETRLEDEGTYKCEVDNGVGKKQEYSMQLVVYSTPKFVEKLVKQLDVKESHNIEVPCKVSGLPEPKVSWTYNGKVLETPQYKDGVLSIAKVNKAATGYYGCKAENEHGVIYAETLVNVV